MNKTKLTSIFICIILLILSPAVFDSFRSIDDLSWQKKTPVVLANEIPSLINQGKKILFLDVREPEEFEEEHIPFAINKPVRFIEHLDLEELKQYDYIIPYCKRDFRGYLGLDKLRIRGVKNLYLIKNFGLKQWQIDGMPTAGSIPKKSDKEAFKEMLKLQ